MKPVPIKVLFIFGTRPEAIKMAPLILKMREHPERFEPLVCVTGQHRQMLDQVLNTFSIRPDIDLRVMTQNQTLAGLTSRILEGVDRVLTRQQPALVLVQGDTTTAFAGALAAFYRGIPVGHVEAGLRTGNMANPFPEEANRVLIDRLARYCFAPTENNRRTLISECVASERIFVTGNTGIDALLITREKVRGKQPLEWLPLFGSAAASVQRNGKPLVLITLHRRESFGGTMQEMFQAIRAAADNHPAVDFIYPVHLNPNVKEPAQAILGGATNVYLIEPLPYEPFVYLMDRASLILTDSGGIQEEAPSLGKPIIVLRENSERQEAIESGAVTLGGTSAPQVEFMISNALAGRLVPPVLSNPYGDGAAAERIIRIIGN